MTKITLRCKKCNYIARRKLAEVVACRGVQETPPERGFCPRGHGELVRLDGVVTFKEPEPVGILVR